MPYRPPRHRTGHHDPVTGLWVNHGDTDDSPGVPTRVLATVRRQGKPVYKGTGKGTPQPKPTAPPVDTSVREKRRTPTANYEVSLNGAKHSVLAVNPTPMGCPTAMAVGLTPLVTRRLCRDTVRRYRKVGEDQASMASRSGKRGARSKAPIPMPGKQRHASNLRYCTQRATPAQRRLVGKHHENVRQERTEEWYTKPTSPPVVRPPVPVNSDAETFTPPPMPTRRVEANHPAYTELWNTTHGHVRLLNGSEKPVPAPVPALPNPSAWWPY
jgi:hypothetical protein